MTEDNNQCQYRRQITSVLKQPNLPRKKRFRMDRYDESSPEEKLSSDYICTAQSRITGSHMQSIFPFLCSNREPLPPKKNSSPYVPIANCSSDRAYSMQSRGHGVTHVTDNSVSMFPLQTASSNEELQSVCSQLRTASSEYGPVRRWFRPEIPIRSARTPSYRAFASQ